MIKRLLTTALTLITLGLSAQEFVDITPEAYVDIRYYCVDSRDDSTIFIGGDDGYLMRSDDQGDNWYIAEKFKNYDIPIIKFIDKDTGFLGSIKELYYTTDGGNTWDSILALPERAQIGYGDQFSRFEIVNDSTYYIIGNPGMIWKSEDKGLTWEEKHHESFDVISDLVTQIHFYSADSGIAWAKRGYHLKTYDGGETWVSDKYTESDKQNTYTNMYFFSPDTGYATTIRGKVMKTVNGGKDWTFFYGTGNNLENLQDIRFFSHSYVHVLSEENFYYSVDSGKTFQKVDIGAKKYIYNFEYLNDSTIIGVGIGTQISKSTDYGKTWETNYYGAPSWL